MMQVIWRIEAEPKRCAIADQVIAESGLAAESLIVVLDDSDYEDCPNPRYSKDIAWYMNIRSGQLEEMSPEHMLEVMDPQRCDHLIWVSKRVAVGSFSRLVWVLAHELRHLRQEIEYPELSTTNLLIKRLSKQVPLKSKYQFGVPAELDAEWAAYQTVVKILGNDALNAFVTEECQRDEKAEPYYKELFVLLPDYCEDWVQQTKKLLCENRKIFERSCEDNVGTSIDWGKLYGSVE
ncbi:MAG: hypothetical protein JRJ38_20265 [Deltaproteobacteria bacterium]|nr:hypothetical protein [Deltaproteobacteria bacterium]